MAQCHRMYHDAESLAEELRKIVDAGVAKRQMAVRLAEAAGEDETDVKVIEKWRRSVYRWLEGSSAEAPNAAVIYRAFGIAQVVSLSSRRGSAGAQAEILERVGRLEEAVERIELQLSGEDGPQARRGGR